MEGAEPSAVFFFAGAAVKWKRPVVPGDTLVMEVEITNWKAKFGIAKATGRAYVDGNLAVEVGRRHSPSPATQKLTGWPCRNARRFTTKSRPRRAAPPGITGHVRPEVRRDAQQMGKTMRATDPADAKRPMSMPCGRCFMAFENQPMTAVCPTG